MQHTDPQKQPTPAQTRSPQPFFGRTVQREPFFQPSRVVPVLQAKLTVGAVGDVYEQEADRVASEVVDLINSPAVETGGGNESVQRMGEEKKELQMQRSPDSLQRIGKEEDELRMKAIAPLQREAMEEEDRLHRMPLVQRVGAEGGEVSEEFEGELNRARGGGQPLATELQAKMGEAMGADFSGVRVHTDGRSDALNQSVGAQAFTTRQDLFFKRGEYQPGSRGGQELIAHELTHVVQQTGGGAGQVGTSRGRLGGTAASGVGMVGEGTIKNRRVVGDAKTKRARNGAEAARTTKERISVRGQEVRRRIKYKTPEGTVVDTHEKKASDWIGSFGTMVNTVVKKKFKNAKSIKEQKITIEELVQYVREDLKAELDFLDGKVAEDLASGIFELALKRKDAYLERAETERKAAEDEYEAKLAEEAAAIARVKADPGIQEKEAKLEDLAARGDVPASDIAQILKLCMDLYESGAATITFDAMVDHQPKGKDLLTQKCRVRTINGRDVTFEYHQHPDADKSSGPNASLEHFKRLSHSDNRYKRGGPEDLLYAYWRNAFKASR